MKKSNKDRKLLEELSRDPRLEQVIAKARRQPRGKARTNVESVTDMFLLVSAIASRFSKKKRARALDELADMVHLLVQVSLLLKENIFDRPEVKKFFRESSKQIYLFAQEWLSMILPRAGIQSKDTRGDRIRPKRERERDSYREAHGHPRVRRLEGKPK